MKILEVKNLKKYFAVKSGFVFERELGVIRAVDDISFFIRKGETLGLVGESGCGKTTTGRLVLRLIEPAGGDIFFREESILEYDRQKMKEFRKKTQVIFQDPYSSLNPRMTVSQIVSEPLVVHGFNRKELQGRTEELLEQVGMDRAFMRRFPHEFSGGQRQRIGIARALALNPEVIICDEPVSALDVSVQAQIVNLLSELQEKLRLSYLFISHDLSVVRHISHRVAVMYMGKIVEIAPANKLYENPQHPYTRILLEAVPIPDPAVKRKYKYSSVFNEEPSSSLKLFSGCSFYDRCHKREEICTMVPPPKIVIDEDQEVFCYLAKKN